MPKSLPGDGVLGDGFGAEDLGDDEVVGGVTDGAGELQDEEEDAEAENLDGGGAIDEFERRSKPGALPSEEDHPVDHEHQAGHADEGQDEDGQPGAEVDGDQQRDEG